MLFSPWTLNINNIICANYSSTLGVTNLTLTKTVTATSNATVHAESQLAAIHLGGSWRLYYQSTDKTLQELIGTGTTWQTGASLVASAIAGSSLAISMVSSPKMNLFYVDSSTSNLFVTSYSRGWITRKLGPSRLDIAGTNISSCCVIDLEVGCLEWHLNRPRSDR